MGERPFPQSEGGTKAVRRGDEKIILHFSAEEREREEKKPKGKKRKRKRELV